MSKMARGSQSDGAGGGDLGILRAYQSTLESKILDSSSFSTGVSANLEAGQ